MGGRSVCRLANTEQPLARRFNCAAVPTLDAATRGQFSQHRRRIVRPGDNGSSLAPLPRVGGERCCSSDISELAVDDVGVQALPAATHQNFTATVNARCVDVRPIAHRYPTAGTDTNATAGAVAACSTTGRVDGYRWYGWVWPRR